MDQDRKPYDPQNVSSTPPAEEEREISAQTCPTDTTTTTQAASGTDTGCTVSGGGSKAGKGGLDETE